MPILSRGDAEPGLPVWRLNRVLAILQSRIETLSKEGKRETPIAWGSAHMYSTIQLAKIAALQQGLNPEIAGLICAFHDIHTLHTNEYEDHGPKAKDYILEIADEYNEKWGTQLGEISDSEITTIYEAIRGHSDKSAVTELPYAELLKDVDSLDAFLHGFEPREGTAREKRTNRMLKEFNVDKQLSELKGKV
ncbi:MAG: HD domain-containing protein [Candidatus Thorarchaeota archaeon]